MGLAHLSICTDCSPQLLCSPCERARMSVTSCAAAPLVRSGLLLGEGNRATRGSCRGGQAGRQAPRGGCHTVGPGGARERHGRQDSPVSRNGRWGRSDFAWEMQLSFVAVLCVREPRRESNATTPPRGGAPAATAAWRSPSDFFLLDGGCSNQGWGP